MEKQIAFLRGINVSGQKKIKMAELRDQLANNGLRNVQTYIQSGNLVFEEASNDKKSLQEKIHQIIKRHFGFDVPVLVLSPKEIEFILKNNPFAAVEAKNQYFALLFEAPRHEMKLNLQPADYPNEKFQITDNCLYLNCLKGAGKAKLNNNIIEQKLGLIATTRNLNTMRKMLELTEQ